MNVTGSALLRGAYYVFWRELKRLVRQRTRIFMAVFQPVIWLVLMGNMMAGLTANPYAKQMLGVDNYLVFMTPGVMAMSSLFGGVFSGISIIWDRRLGFLHKMLTSPIPRFSIPLGKIWAIVMQIFMQMLIIIAIAYALGVRFVTGPGGVVVMLVFCGLLGSVMGGISLAVATAIKTPETLFAVINFLTMPLIFSSNAMFPLAAMPLWLQVIARYNPISYAVLPMRTLAATGWIWPDLLLGFFMLLLLNVVILLIVYHRFEKGLTI
ncbi:MAG: ABC transporter permease [Bacillota bacterium]